MMRNLVSKRECKSIAEKSTKLSQFMLNLVNISFPKKKKIVSSKYS